MGYGRCENCFNGVLYGSETGVPHVMRINKNNVGLLTSVIGKLEAE
jgi:hypothetical protein